jgi:hypothetical protein
MRQWYRNHATRSLVVEGAQVILSSKPLLLFELLLLTPLAISVAFTARWRFNLRCIEHA